MVPVLSLWLPILVSAVVIFVVSALLHTVLRYHASDLAALPAEDEIMTELGRHDIPPGTYVMPHAPSSAAKKEPVYLEKRERGPVAFVTVLPRGDTDMGRQLTTWFVYCVVVGAFAASTAARNTLDGLIYGPLTGGVFGWLWPGT